MRGCTPDNTRPFLIKMPVLNIEWDDMVLSDWALQEFLGWWPQQTTGTKQKVIDKIYMVDHARCGHRPQPIGLDIGNNRVQIKTMHCMDVGCFRCGIGTPWNQGFGPNGKSGGYRFQWKGPWTVRSRVPHGYDPYGWRNQIADEIATEQAGRTGGGDDAGRAQ
jgi:hypothetical protein